MSVCVNILRLWSPCQHTHLFIFDRYILSGPVQAFANLPGAHWECVCTQLFVYCRVATQKEMSASRDASCGCGYNMVVSSMEEVAWSPLHTWKPRRNTFFQRVCWVGSVIIYCNMIRHYTQLAIYFDPSWMPPFVSLQIKGIHFALGWQNTDAPCF